MRTLFAVIAIALLAVTSAAADTDITSTPSADTTQAQQALAQAQAELATAQATLQSAAAESSKDATAVAASAQASAELEKALATAQLATTLPLTSETMREADLLAAVGDDGNGLARLRQALSELSKSGDLTPAGAEKLNALVDKLDALKQLRVYTLPSPRVAQSQNMDGLPQAPMMLGLPGACWNVGGPNELNVEQLEERLRSLQGDTKELETKLKLLEELQQSGKLDDLKHLSTSGLPGLQILQREALPGQADARGYKVLTIPDAAQGQAGHVTVYNLSGSDSGNRMLVLNCKADGSVDVSGAGLSDAELEAIREQLKGQQGTLKLTLPGVKHPVELSHTDGSTAVFTYILPDDSRAATAQPSAEANSDTR